MATDSSVTWGLARVLGKNVSRTEQLPERPDTAATQLDPWLATIQALAERSMDGRRAWSTASRAQRRRRLG